jgi:hypothetical protein
MSADNQDNFLQAVFEQIIPKMTNPQKNNTRTEVNRRATDKLRTPRESGTLKCWASEV